MADADFIPSQVRPAARLLDKHFPGWALKVDLTTFDFDSCRLCVLGQVFGDYAAGLEAIHRKTGKLAWSINAFNNHIDGRNGSQHLKRRIAAWVRAIKSRQVAAQLANPREHF